MDRKKASLPIHVLKETLQAPYTHWGSPVSLPCVPPVQARVHKQESATVISFLPSLRHAAAFAVPTHFSVCLEIAIYDDDLAFLSLIPGRILRRVIPIVPQRIRNTLTLWIS